MSHTHHRLRLFKLPILLLLGALFVGLVSLDACTPQPPKESPSEGTTEPTGKTETSLEPPAERRQEPPREPTPPEPMSDNDEPPQVDKPAEPQREPDSSSHDGGPDGMEPTADGPDHAPEPAPDAPQGPCDGTNHTYPFGGDTVTVRCQAQGSRRSYTIATTHALRDNLPASKQVTITEPTDQPYLRSGHVLFDALYAMGIHEATQNSVSQVHEGAFQQGKPYNCRCFQTGEKWTWAWTRDTAYAIDLALAAFDPDRSLETLLFKLSSTKSGVSGPSPQIVQDTGTGGSWPVSSDRIVWATGLQQLLYYTTKSLPQTAFDALWQTIQHDRKWVFDPNDGLYRGEQSFLDWREQSYPSWSRERIETIAMSKALSTNVNHLVGLQTMAALAKAAGRAQIEAQVTQWATALKAAIASEFKLASTPLLSTMKTHTLASAPARRFDLLGNALAVIFGVVDASTAAQIVAAYPHSDQGPPVQWPQQPLTPIYHNRAIWPFVTAYWLRAAKKVKNAAVVSHNLRSLAKGAALNLSHMENFEFATLANYRQDGSYSGPVINSRRQLWSVAGYLSAIQDVIFGLQASRQVAASGPTFAWKPFVPRALRSDWLPADQLTLHNFPLHGKRIDVTIKLPPISSDTTDAYAIGAITFNGVARGDTSLSPSDLKATNTLVIQLVAPTAPTASTITIVKENGDFRRIFSPREAAITSLKRAGSSLALTIDSQGEAGTEHVIYRDGKQVATGVKAGSWTDPGPIDLQTLSPCYSVVAYFPTTGLYAHHSRPVCWRGVDDVRMQVIDAWQWRHSGGRWGYGPGGEGLFKQWGGPTDTLEVTDFRPHWTGSYYARLTYRNPTGATSTGITAATKRVDFIDQATDKVAASITLTMPQSGQARIALSTIAALSLDASKRYRLRISDPGDIVNMSYLSHFTAYNGGAGGGTTSTNSAEIISLSLWPSQGTDKTPTTGKLIPFDGSNDLNKIPSSQWVTPATTLATWERFGLSWDADWLYIAVVSKGFEQPLKAFVLYLESATGALGAATPATGMTYLQLTPKLPFAPSHAIGLRQSTDNNDGFGPWNGIWREQSGTWSLQRRLKPGRETFLAADKHTLSARIPRALLGAPQRIRLVGHLVNAVSANEWKDVLPPKHTPWQAHTTGYYEIDLSASPGPASGWTLK